MHLKQLVPALAVLVGGCASLPPSLRTAGSVAREVSCAVCEASSEAPVDERAAALADGLQRVSEELAAAAERGDSPEVAAILAELGSHQEAERALFERLLRAAAGAP